MKVLVTGGSGFIGSHFVKKLLDNEYEVVNLDKSTYAAEGKNLEHMGLSKKGNYHFILGDICDSELVERVFEKEKPEMIFNFAAESHVDRSITNPDSFIQSNIIGATNIFNSALRYKPFRVVQISTDEVYGSIESGSFSEYSKLNPSSPYSASKASAELIGLSFFKSFNLPLIITRSANNYGSYQFPEKLLPLFITNLLEGKKVPLMWSEGNPGLNQRDWLHVEDNCNAIYFLGFGGKEGEVYNIPGRNEKTNIEVTHLLLNAFGFGEEKIEKVPHRSAHDFRYSINGDKLLELGFEYEHLDFEEELQELIRWYKENKSWWGKIK
jgi:dTDP-glucose 4,6-dehydratase